MTDFGLALIASVFGGLVIIIGQFFFRLIVVKHGHFTGVWEGRVLDSEGNIIKRDILKMRQHGEKIYGDIQRIQPPEENHHEYKFIGRIQGKSLFAIFWPTDSLTLSYGCTYLEHQKSHTFTGYYLKLDQDQKTIIPVPGEIVRLKSFRNGVCKYFPNHYQKSN